MARLTPYLYLDDRPVTRSELQFEPVGGMQIQIRQLADVVDRLGVAQTVVMPARRGFRGELPFGSHGRLRCLPMVVVPVRTRAKGYAGLLVSWTAATLAWAAAARLRGMADRYDVVHVHCSELPWTFLLATLVRRLLGRPLLLTVHCSAIATFHPDTAVGRALGALARAAERRAVRAADGVIVLTERVRRAYIEAGLAAGEAITVIPDGVDVGCFSAAEAAAVDPPPGHEATVLYAGRLAPEKGWRDLVAAAAILRGRLGTRVRFVVCGDGNEREACAREVRRLGLADAVELTGFVGRARMAGLMREADVVVVPSLHEELGGTVLEALLLGRGVVATAVGGIPEVVQDGVTGLTVPPRDPCALAVAVERLVTDPGLRRRLGAAGQRGALRYDSRTVGRAVVEQYGRHAAAAGRR